MPSILVSTLGVSIAAIAISCSLFLDDCIHKTLGFRRVIQDSSDFPSTCRKIRDPTAEGCEHLWIDHRELYAVLSGGDVAYCPASGLCRKASGNVKFKMPNGLARGADSRILVPSAFLGKIWVIERNEDSYLKKVAEINLEMPIDNLSVEATGDILGAGFPDVLKFVNTIPRPHELESPTTIWRFRQQVDANDGFLTYLQEKILEDKAMIGIAGATTAVHDTATGRLFLGGNYAPYISVCERDGEI